MSNELCSQFPRCGGCAWQDMTYAAEIEMKTKKVLTLLSEAGIEDFEFLGCFEAQNADSYRNKMEFNFGDEGMDSSIQLGMRKRKSRYEVSDGSKCLICDEDMRLCAEVIRDYFIETGMDAFYNKTRHTGSLRNAIIRKAFFTGEIMVNFVTTSDLKSPLEPLVERLLALGTKGVIKTILHTLNDTVADAIKPDSQPVILFGEPFIREELLGLTFKISPFSFFQTNSLGASELYKTVVDFAGDVSDCKKIYDLYCGTGTIAQILASSAEEIVGVELVEEAVEAAKQNAELNGLSNCKFIAADVLKFLEDEPIDGRDCLVVVDPPRDGLNPKALAHLINAGVEKIVYVSCKPSSLARDLAVFIQNGYRAVKIKCHDMFPRTDNIETVCLIVKD